MKELNTLVAELKQSPIQEFSRSSSSWPSSDVAQSSVPSGQQQRQVQDNLAQLKKWKASCADEQTMQWLDTRISELPWGVYSSADRVSQGRGEEGSRQHRAHVSSCCRGFREDRGSESAQGCRQGDHFPSPDEAAHGICPARTKPSCSCFSGAAPAVRSGILQTRPLVLQTSSLLFAVLSFRI